MSSIKPECHVAQQIRRDKLRISSSQHSHEFPNNLEHLSLHPGFGNLELVQVRNVRNANMLDESQPQPVVYSSEMPNFSSASNPLSSPRNALEFHNHQELCDAEPSNRLIMNHHHHHNQYGSFPPHPTVSAIHSSHKDQCELRSLGNWRNSASDWVMNSYFASELNNVSSYNELSQQLGLLQNNSPPPLPSPPSSSLFQSALQDIVKSASINAQRQDLASLMQENGQYNWAGSANEVEFQPICYTNRTMNSNLMNDSNPQTLSLSLSSNANSKPSFVEEPSMISRACGKSSFQDTLGNMHSNSKTTTSAGVATTSGYRNVGPLGPFTGYATILKNSRFLKSAQQLLDEICCSSGSKLAKESCDVSKRVSGEVSAETLTVHETRGAAKCSISGSSSSMLYVSKENSGDWGVGRSSGFGISARPDYQQKKTKLLQMQEEVSRQCKQYHQQMQMVVSSFESVAGLSSATPYISLALKSVSKHFKCLKNSISDQLKFISEILGEDSAIPANKSTCSRGDTINEARLRCMDQSFQKNNKYTRGSTDLVEPQHVWRPQRGLPERAVAILKAWLFEHFLHPYPTDTDKHMLANQTGLSRNQVSNWFINARVRVWKPMVEEIHMLETKATSTNENRSENEGTSGTEGGTNHQGRVVVDNKPLSKLNAMHSIPGSQFPSLEMNSSIAGGNAVESSGMNAEEWCQGKRSKLECQEMASNVDGTVMGFVPYRRGGIEVGGIGSVSLTLGLRHGVEGVQQHHQQQLQEEQLRRHLGGHMIHDFVG